jgi:hypothetical protein
MQGWRIVSQLQNKMRFFLQWNFFRRGTWRNNVELNIQDVTLHVPQYFGKQPFCCALGTNNPKPKLDKVKLA